FPDRALVTMTTHFMRSYSLLAIATCHRREIHAIGGMSAFIPVKNDPAANERAFAQVRADKDREANDGHDGTWVAHPGMVALATEAFDAVMKTPNQIHKKREDVEVSAADLLDFVTGPITEAGLRTNISVGIQYIEAWLGGQGAVPIFNLMEDAATAEISRSQVWQWIHSPKGVVGGCRKDQGGAAPPVDWRGAGEDQGQLWRREVCPARLRQGRRAVRYADYERRVHRVPDIARISLPRLAARKREHLLTIDDSAIVLRRWSCELGRAA